MLCDYDFFDLEDFLGFVSGNLLFFLGVCFWFSWLNGVFTAPAKECFTTLLLAELTEMKK